MSIYFDYNRDSMKGVVYNETKRRPKYERKPVEEKEIIPRRDKPLSELSDWSAEYLNKIIIMNKGG